MDRRFDIVQQILDDITEDSGFLGILLSSEEGLIITNSNTMDSEVELESLAAKAATIFNENGAISEDPIDMTITYPNRKIFIQRFSLSEENNPILLLIAIMAPSVRYFKRKLNQVKKNLTFTS